MSTAMTAAERGELSRVIRLRAKVAKDEARALGARRVAEGEAQLAHVFEAEDERWSELSAHARKECKALDAELARRARDAGIPEQFRPSINYYFSGRGENQFAERRAELRRVLRAEVDANVKDAFHVVDKWTADKLTEIASGALVTDASKKFLDDLPPAESLVPAPKISHFPAPPLALPVAAAPT